MILLAVLTLAHSEETAENAAPAKNQAAPPSGQRSERGEELREGRGGAAPAPKAAAPKAAAAAKPGGMMAGLVNAVTGAAAPKAAAPKAAAPKAAAPKAAAPKAAAPAAANDELPATLTSGHC